MPVMTEIERWRNARLYALKHSCDEAMAATTPITSWT